MLIKLFMLILLSALPISASYNSYQPPFKDHVPSMSITIDDLNKVSTITAQEHFADPYDKDVAYSIRLAVCERTNKRIPTYYKTVYSQDWRPLSKVKGKTERVQNIPAAKKEEFKQRISDAVLRHLYLYTLDRKLTIKEFLSQIDSGAEICFEPGNWIKKIATLRKTEWVCSPDQDHVRFMGQREANREKEKAARDAAWELYQQSKKKEHKEEYERLQLYCQMQLNTNNSQKNSFGSQFLGWRSSILTAIAFHQKQAQKRALFKQ